MLPTSSAHCRSCGYRVGFDVAEATLVLLLQWSPLFVLIFLIGIGVIINPLPWVFIWLVCLFVGLFCNAFLIPLMPDELVTPQMAAERKLQITAKRAARRTT